MLKLKNLKAFIPPLKIPFITKFNAFTNNNQNLEFNKILMNCNSSLYTLHSNTHKNDNFKILNFTKNAYSITNSHMKKFFSLKSRPGKYKNPFIKKKPKPEIKTVFYNFAEDNNNINEFNKIMSSYNSREDGNPQNNRNINNKSYNPSNEEDREHNNEFNNIYSKIKNFNLDEIQESEIYNKDCSSSIEDNYLENKDIINKKKEVSGQNRGKNGQLIFSNKMKSKSYNSNIIKEESIELRDYIDQYNFILNLKIDNKNNKYSNVNQTRYVDKITNLPNYTSNHIDENFENLNNNKINSNGNSRSKESMPDDASGLNRMNDNEENYDFLYSNNYVDAKIYNDKLINDYNSYKPSSETNNKGKSEEKLSEQEFYHNVLVPAFYKLIDLIPPKHARIQYYIDIIKLIDLKRVVDENLIFYFMEKILNTLIRVNMYNFCNTTCKMVRFLCILRFYVENSRNISLIDRVFYQFLDDHFINLSKRELLIKRNKFNRYRGEEDETSERDNNYIKDNIKTADDNPAINEGVSNSTSSENFNLNKNENFVIKNKRLEAFIVGHISQDANEIFDLNYTIEKEKVLSFQYKNIRPEKAKLKANNNANNLNNFSSFSDFMKDEEKKELELNKHKKSTATNDSDKDEYNIKKKELEFINSAKTVEELEKKKKQYNNDRNRQVEDQQANHDFNDMIVNNIDKNEILSNELDKEKIVDYLIEEQKKYIKILDFIKLLDLDEVKTEKRIILIKILKITFLIKLHKYFDSFEEPKFISEILRTYRYLFISNIDFKICDMFIKRIILLVHKAKFYNSFILSKNVFMILRELSVFPENHQLIKERSDYFKVIFNSVFEKISYSNLNLISFKEIGMVIYMLGETQLGTQETQDIVNNYVLKEMTNSFRIPRITDSTFQLFVKYVNFVLMGYISNLENYNYKIADKLIISVLRNSETLPFKNILTLSMSFLQLNHTNMDIWRLLYIHFIKHACFNKEKREYNIKQILDYTKYILKRIPQLDEINKPFINFYFQKYYELIISRFQKKNSRQTPKNKSIENLKEANCTGIDYKVLLDQSIPKEDELLKLKEEIEESEVDIKIKNISNNPSESNAEIEIINPTIIQETQGNKEEKSEAENEEQKISFKIKAEMDELISKLISNSIEFKENLLSEQTEFQIVENIDKILVFFEICNKNNDCVDSSIVSNYILIKLNTNENFLYNNPKILKALNLQNEEILQEPCLENLKEILMHIDFDKIPNFENFLRPQIFNSNTSDELLNKFYAFVGEKFILYRNYSSGMNEKEKDVHLLCFYLFQSIYENLKESEKISDELIQLKNEINNHIFDNFQSNNNLN